MVVFFYFFLHVFTATSLALFIWDTKPFVVLFVRQCCWPDMGLLTKSSVLAGLCAGELEERFPYWDNMHRELWPLLWGEGGRVCVCKRERTLKKTRNTKQKPRSCTIKTKQKGNRERAGTSRRRTHAHQLLLFVHQPSGPKITHASVLLSDRGRADLAEGGSWEYFQHTHTHINTHRRVISLRKRNMKYLLPRAQEHREWRGEGSGISCCEILSSRVSTSIPEKQQRVTQWDGCSTSITGFCVNREGKKESYYVSSLYINKDNIPSKDPKDLGLIFAHFP